MYYLLLPTILVLLFELFVVGTIANTQQSQDKIENKTHFQAPQHKLSPVREVARAFETELHIIYYVAGEK